MSYVQRIQPAAIKKVWSDIRFALEKSLPPTGRQDYHSYTEILAKLLSGKAQCWVMYEQEEEKYKLHGLVVTIIINDPLTGDKYLHLYAMYAFRPLTVSEWNRLQDIIETFAKGNDCHALTSFTNSKVIARHFQSRGGQCDWQYWYKEL